MRIGIVVDGETEFYGLKPIARDLADSAGHELIGLYKANIQPHAPPGVAAAACKARVIQLLSRGVDRVIVMVDQETRDCPPTLAQELETALAHHCGAPVAAVVKSRMVENWVIADCDALAAQAARFDSRRVAAARRKVEPGKADAVPALATLKAAVIGKTYDKVADGTRTLHAADPLTIATHSRSFRRFVRLLGHPAYADQSRSPART